MSEEEKDSIMKVKHISYEILAPILIIIGILGNMINLVVLGRPFLKGRSKIYLRALAIADLNVLIFEVPVIIRLTDVQAKSKASAFYYAHFELILVTIFVAFTSYIVLCVTIDRYISVCAPLLYNSVHNNKRNAHIALIISFVLAIIASAPLVLMKQSCRTDEANDMFNVQENTKIVETFYWNLYIISSEIVIRIIPAILIVLLNIVIIFKFRVMVLKRKTKSIANSPTPVSYCRMKRHREEKRLILLLFAIVILYLFTMIPSSCLSIIYSDRKNSDLTFQIFRAIANLLELANSSLNFCAYFLCSSDFRRCLKNIITQKELSSYTSSSRSNDIKVGYVVNAT